MIGLLRARLPGLAWELAEYVARRTGIPSLDLLRRAWCRAIGVRYRRPCSVGRCLQPAERGRAWCAGYAPGVAA